VHARIVSGDSDCGSVVPVSIGDNEGNVFSFVPVEQNANEVSKGFWKRQQIQCLFLKRFLFPTSTFFMATALPEMSLVMVLEVEVRRKKLHSFLL
jgi:hypothetical protein